MSDPRRWLEEGAPPALTEVLKSAELDEPAPEKLAALAASLAPLLVVPGGGGGSGGGAPGGGSPAPGAGGGGGGAVMAGAKVAGVKLALGVGGKVALVAAVSSLAVGVILQQREPRAAPVPPTPVGVTPPPVVVTAPVAPAVPPPSHVTPRPRPLPAPAPALRPVSPPAAPPTTPPPAPRDELDVLQDAMEAVRTSHPADALAMLERHARAYPDSALAQEREVLTIEALMSLGRAMEAKDKAASFRARWPTSTHLVRIEALLRQP